VSGGLTGGARAFALACIALVHVLALGARTAQAAATELAPTVICFGTLDDCERPGAAFRPHDGVTNVGRLLPSGGIAEGDAITVGYEVPAGVPIFARGESNAWRMRSSTGDRSVVTGPIHLAPAEIVRDVRGRVLLEARLGAGRTIWAYPLWVGGPRDLDDLVARQVMGPCIVIGWLFLGGVQQVFAIRRTRYRRAVVGLALTLLGIATRTLALQMRYSTLFEGRALLQRYLEIMPLPIGGLGWGLFYLWLAGVDPRSRLGRGWFAVALSVVVFLAASVLVPQVRVLGLNVSYAFVTGTFVLLLVALRSGWSAIHDDERVLVAVAAGATVVTVLYDIVFAGKFGRGYGMGLSPVGFIVETLCQAAILSRRNARAHARVDELAGELETKNVALTDANARLEATNVVLAAELEERRRLQGELGRATQQLTQAEHMATLGMLMAGIAHDLRNPIHAVRGCAESMHDTLDSLARAPAPEHPALVAGARETLGWIDQSMASMDALSLAMRNQSRTGSAEEADLVDLAEVVHEALLLCRSRTRLCELEVDAPNAVVQVDATGLGQLVMNLVSNAADAVAEAREREPSRVASLRVSARVEGERVLIAIEDSGFGVPEQVRTRILEPFFTTKPRGQGTGLGLAIVQRVVRDHGGSLEIGRSEALGGARFAVSIRARGAAETR
jgi:signal transduction histidine kinase